MALVTIRWRSMFVIATLIAAGVGFLIGALLTR